MELAQSLWMRLSHIVIYDSRNFQSGSLHPLLLVASSLRASKASLSAKEGKDNCEEKKLKALLVCIVT